VITIDNLLITNLLSYYIILSFQACNYSMIYIQN